MVSRRIPRPSPHPASTRTHAPPPPTCPRSRVEYFVFSLLAEMQGKEGQVQLYAILRDGRLKQYEQVMMIFESGMPSRGALSNPDDKALVKGLEDQIIDVYGRAIVEIKCRKAEEGERVNLGGKMLRPQHVESLMAAVNKYRVTELGLCSNQLGSEGGAKLAEALKTNTSLACLRCALAALEPMPSARSCVAAPRVTRPPLCVRSLPRNGLDDSSKQAVRAAAGSRVELPLLDEQ